MTEDESKHQSPSQPATLPQRSAEELLAVPSAPQSRTARRNRSDYVGGAVVVLVFCYYAWYFPYWVTKLGAALVVLGTLVVLWQFHLRAKSRSLSENLDTQSLQLQRAELIRQRDTLRTGWLWYLGPLLPGLAVFMWGIQGGSAKRFELLVDLAMLAVFVAVIWINQRGAATLQRRIDALDAQIEPAANGSA